MPVSRCDFNTFQVLFSRGSKNYLKKGEPLGNHQFLGFFPALAPTFWAGGTNRSHFWAWPIEQLPLAEFRSPHPQTWFSENGKSTQSLSNPSSNDYGLNIGDPPPPKKNVAFLLASEALKKPTRPPNESFSGHPHPLPTHPRRASTALDPWKAQRVWSPGTKDTSERLRKPLSASRDLANLLGH